MKIWKVGHYEFNKIIVPKNRWNLKEARTFDGRKKEKDWEVTEVVEQLGTHRRRYSELMTFTPGPTCILSENAVEILYEIIEKDAELLPVKFRGQNFWLMYVTTVLDCVNFDKSIVDYTLYGKVSHFKRLVFKESAIGNHNLFLIKQTLLGHTYASSIFKNQVQRIDDKALSFKLVYDSCQQF